ncbi:MAG TPA: hypothetical protein VK422_18925 [Pyrinomonadaceae bacterium]|nr:hypothetical protein [Pyrinomonadaceae bacterium]
MKRLKTPKPYALALALVLLGSTPAPAQTPASAPAPGSPSEVVRAFYTALRERRFREAFEMSVFRPAVEGLTPEEYEDLRADFEPMATNSPEEVVITGEQVSGEDATVFMKLGDGGQMKVEPVYLIREKGRWVVGDREGRESVKKAGKRFFFDVRIDTHHVEVEKMLSRISAAQILYAQQHGGAYGDLEALIRAGLVPDDVRGTQTTGYRFTVVPAKGGKSYEARAEPERYGRTGKLSFYMDPAGSRRKDAGGKPIK